MKHWISKLTQNKIKTRILPIIVAMTLVCLYQLYWLIGQYNELDSRLHEDIQEALRSSDFEELAHRVDEISRMEYQGRVDVNVGYDNDKKTAYVESEVSEVTTERVEPDSKADNQTIVSPSSFGSVLKKPEDLVKIGLDMQRGIHSGIDGIKEINLNYLDGILTGKLLELGLDGEHQLLYLRNRPKDGNSLSADIDTLGRLGNLEFQPKGVFRLKISGDSEYVMTIPKWRFVVLKKMIPVIIFSVSTFLLLILTFRYLFHTMRKQRLLDELKTDFTNNITHELQDTHRCGIRRQ